MILTFLSYEWAFGEYFKGELFLEYLLLHMVILLLSPLLCGKEMRMC